MRLIARAEFIDKGEIRAFGLDGEKDLEDFNRLIGFVSENINYTVPSKVSEIFALHKLMRPVWDVQFVNQSLNVLGIDSRKPYGSLSRGQKMQVAFILATAFKPKLLLLDEITSVLDAMARDFFMLHLKRLVEEGTTVLLATNIISEVQGSAGHLIMISDKKIVLDAPVLEIARKIVKVRKPADFDHPIFSHPTSVQIGLNSVGEVYYLVTPDAAKQLPESLHTGEIPNNSEIFIFFSQVK